MPPNFETLLPLISGSCSEEILAYSKGKTKSITTPEATSEGDKVLDCVKKLYENIDNSPCAELLKKYESCVSSEGLYECQDASKKLTECGAKNK